jgi:D-arabinitol 4-dehydrogenase
MNKSIPHQVSETRYNPSDCDIGVVHLGYGAFHRAHQAVYLDNYMELTGDLSWGIAAVNLREAEAGDFATNDAAQNGYLLKSVAPSGEITLSRVRSHVLFLDWTVDREETENLLAHASVNLVTITVTESGYYTDPTGNLDRSDPTIASEVDGDVGKSVYAFLANGLEARRIQLGAPITVCCCDNIRKNGKMLERNFASYLEAIGREELKDWVHSHVTFPCSMVDRITPRSTSELVVELSALTGKAVAQPIMAEAFLQWVLEDRFASEMPDLSQVGVTVTKDVNPFEETKIRVLNGGHTCLAYLAALRGIEAFDQAMETPDLFAHFWHYETQEVLPALTIDLPLSKTAYLDRIADRFRNEAIGDTVARICSDGMAKFPIFIRPTLEDCLAQGLMPLHGLKSIASWHTFAKHVAAGRIPFDYIEPSWSQLKNLLGTEDFILSKQLWGELPKEYPEFSKELRAAIKEMDQSWPV